MNVRMTFMPISLALILSSGMSLSGAMTPDEQKLETDRQTIDQHASDDNQKVQALAKQYNVPPETVQGLHDKGQGWGEVSISLATAQELAKNDPKTYPTLGDASKKVQEMRASGMGWGKIAKDLGFKLGPVVSASHHTTNALRAEQTGKPDTTGKPEHTGKPDSMGKPDNTGRPDHAGRPDHPDKPDHPGH